MFLIIEIAMLVGGLYSLIFAKVPSFLVDVRSYQLEDWAARFLGALLIIPLPVVIIGSFFLALLSGEDGLGYAMTLEFLIVFNIILLCLVWVRVLGRKSELISDKGLDF